MELVENKLYVVKDKNGNDMIWKFKRYITYNTLPTDCIFEHISGSNDIVKNSPIKPELAFPLGLIDKLKISLHLTDDDKKNFIKNNLEFIKTRKCFVDNLTIKDSIDSINEGLLKENKMLKIYEELLSLYDNDRNKYGKDIDEANTEINKIKSFDRTFFIKILETYDDNERIKNII